MTKYDHINNYYLLVQFTNVLEKIFAGSKVQKIEEFRSKEVMLYFENLEKKVQIHASAPSFAFITEHEKKGGRPVFGELNGKTLHRVYANTYDRSLRFVFNNEVLQVNLYGINSNVLVFDNNGNLIEMLFENREKDRSKALSDYQNFSLDIIPKAFTDEIYSFAGINVEDTQEEKRLKAEATESYLTHPAYYLYNTESAKGFKPHPRLSFYSSGKAIFHTDDVFEATSEYARLYYSATGFNSLKTELINYLTQKLKHLNITIRSAVIKLSKLDDKKSPKYLADLIMANLHAIPDGSLSIDLPDFESGEPVSIKLKKGISPQKMAEKLYQKSKLDSKEKIQIVQNLDKFQNAVLELQMQLEQIQNTMDFKELRKYKKDVPEEEDKKVSLPYRKFHVFSCDILVGKNAQTNDELSFRVAGKEDLWLHARDVSGSHVVIKSGAAEVSKEILETAAGLAAYYSKSKTSGLVPVIYTKRKFVRKPKGAHPGEVIVEKEQTIIIEPLNPAKLNRK